MFLFDFSNVIMISDVVHCPGRYCGRTFINGNWTNCGACLRGYRTNGSHCMPCSDTPEFYDWLYLLFMVLVPLLLHWFCIDFTSQKKKFTVGVIALHLSAIVEVSIAAIITLLLMDPIGTFGIHSCRNQQLSDWYTLLHNPNPNYEEVLHCTQEAVYPLYTIVFIFYALAALLMLLIRPWLTSHYKTGNITIYAGLYFYPILSLFHAVFGGIIHYTYPCVVIVASLISSATHFACKEDQSIKGLILSSITDVRNAIILLGHWLLHAFGIVAVTQLKDPSLNGPLLALVPIPTVFYILTARFTDPTKHHIE